MVENDLVIRAGTIEDVLVFHGTVLILRSRLAVEPRSKHEIDARNCIAVPGAIDMYTTLSVHWGNHETGGREGYRMNAERPSVRKGFLSCNLSGVTPSPHCQVIDRC